MTPKKVQPFVVAETKRAASCIGCYMRDIPGCTDEERYSRTKGDDPVQPPAAYDIVQRPAAGGILLPLAKGKLGDPGRREDLRHCGAGWPLVILQIVWILYAAALHAIPAGAA